MMAQWLYNLMISIPEKKFIYAAVLKIISLIRDLVVKIANDPLIKYKIGKFILYFPLSHELGIYKKVFPAYASNVGRIAKHVKARYKNLTFIDIGANVGDSIAILRNEEDFPILAIEGESRFYSILEKNSKQFPDVEIVNAFVGETSEEIKKKILKERGTSSLVEDKSGKDGSSAAVANLPGILKRKAAFYNSKMVKIDTDGFDNKIIRGAAEWLSEVKPVLFFEYDPFYLAKQSDDGLSVFSTLSSIGYKALLIYQNNGDYMFSMAPSDKVLSEEIHNYFSGRDRELYCDICAFPEEDIDLFENVRVAEMKFFKTLRQFESI